MDNASSGYNPGTEVEFVWKNEIKEEEFISLSKNDFPETNFHEEIVEQKHSPIKSWNSLRWTCSYCSKNFEDFSNLKAHQESVHQIFTSADTCFECIDCKEVLLGYSTFLNHIRACHYEALKLCCDVCNELLLDYEQLSRHRDEHNETLNQNYPTVYHCTLCEEVHSTEKLLKHHIQESHNLKSTDQTYENKLLSHAKDEERRHENEKNGSVSIESIKCEDEYGETELTLQSEKYVENRLLSYANDKEESYVISTPLTPAAKRPKTLAERQRAYRLRQKQKRLNNPEETKLQETPKNKGTFPRKYIFSSTLKKLQNDNGDMPVKKTRADYQREYRLRKKLKAESNSGSAKIVPLQEAGHSGYLAPVTTAQLTLLGSIKEEFVCVNGIKEEEFISPSEKTVSERNTSDIKKDYNEKVHLHSPTDGSSRKCNVCGKQFASKSNLNFHMKIHSDERPFKCDICSKDFKVKSILKAHMQTHTGERPFKCEMCCKMFYEKYKLKMHMTIHASERPFNCDICPMAFKRKDYLENHLKVHITKEPFKCETCSKEFKTKQKLEKHMKTHSDERPFNCDTCSKGFKWKSDLKSHLTIHNNERSFKCDFCLKEFALEPILKKHMKTHSDERPFKCDTCSKGFRWKSDLEIHLRTHTNVRPFKCDACSKRFSIKSSLTDHKKFHNNDRPFKCDFCLKTFIKKSKLTIHMRMHTNERPFKCETCSKEFISKTVLKSHMKIHNRQRPFKRDILS